MEKKLRVLLVDDDEVMLGLLVTLVRRLGLACDVAKDGEQALQRVARTDYDLIVTDVGMPVLDGYGLIQGVRDRGSRVPIVVISGLDIDADRLRGENDIQGFLEKPFRVEEFRSAVEAALGGR